MGDQGKPRTDRTGRLIMAGAVLVGLAFALQDLHEFNQENVEAIRNMVHRRAETRARWSLDRLPYSGPVRTLTMGPYEFEVPEPEGCRWEVVDTHPEYIRPSGTWETALVCGEARAISIPMRPTRYYTNIYDPDTQQAEIAWTLYSELARIKAESEIYCRWWSFSKHADCQYMALLSQLAETEIYLDTDKRFVVREQFEYLAVEFFNLMPIQRAPYRWLILGYDADSKNIAFETARLAASTQRLIGERSGWEVDWSAASSLENKSLIAYQWYFNAPDDDAAINAWKQMEQDWDLEQDKKRAEEGYGYTREWFRKYKSARAQLPPRPP